MKIVITGACGHIGSRLFREISSAFPMAEVMAVDNLRTERYVSLFGIPNRDRVRFLQADILQINLDRLFEEAEFVIHLAAVTDTNGSEEINLRNQEINLQAVQSVSSACARSGSVLLFPSTTSVYAGAKGQADESFLTDEAQLLNPYFRYKLKSEKYIENLGQMLGLKFVILRLGTIFGVSPGMAFHTAVSKFCWQAAMAQPMTAWKSALQQKRPYLGLGDAVRAFEFFLKKGVGDCQIYNVVTTHASVEQVLELILKSVPKAKIELVDAIYKNDSSFEVSSTRIQRLGFIFKDSLDIGIQETIEALLNRGFLR